MAIWRSMSSMYNRFVAFYGIWQRCRSQVVDAVHTEHQEVARVGLVLCITMVPSA